MKTSKAAIDLSLNTIVIVIFAITVLGLGLFLITRLFGNITPPTPPTLSNPPTAQDPFTISDERLTLFRGGYKLLQVGIFNMGADVATYKLEVAGDCTGPEFKITPSNDKIDTRTIKQQETGKWALSIRAQKTAPSNDYSCTVRGFSEDGVYEYNQDFFIEVK